MYNLPKSGTIWSYLQSDKYCLVLEIVREYDTALLRPGKVRILVESGKIIELTWFPQDWKAVEL